MEFESNPLSLVSFGALGVAPGAGDSSREGREEGGIFGGILLIVGSLQSFGFWASQSFGYGVEVSQWRGGFFWRATGGDFACSPVPRRLHHPVPQGARGLGHFFA